MSVRLAPALTEAVVEEEVLAVIEEAVWAVEVVTVIEEAAAGAGDAPGRLCTAPKATDC